jgi:O-methyltransferase involved in polyketide biosynthesis
MTILPASNFNKISPTALFVAYTRQFSDIPYAKEVAELTNAATIVKKQFVDDGQEPIVLAALFEARYKAIEMVRARFNGTQILELASGLLPRGMILSQNPDITFVESDLAGMIQQKQQLVQQLIGSRPNLHFLALDATDKSNPLLIQADYFHSEKPVTLLCEGLLMYLTFAEKRQLCANVREMLLAYGGVWITSDFTTKARRAWQMQQSDSAVRQVNQKIMSLTGRTFMENEFDDLDHAKQFVRAQGFRVETFSMLEVIDRLSCVSVLEIDPERIKPLLASTPVFALTLA